MQTTSWRLLAFSQFFNSKLSWTEGEQNLDKKEIDYYNITYNPAMGTPRQMHVDGELFILH